MERRLCGTRDQKYFMNKRTEVVGKVRKGRYMQTLIRNSKLYPLLDSLLIKVADIDILLVDSRI